MVTKSLPRSIPIHAEKQPDPGWLRIDPQETVRQIEDIVREQVFYHLQRKGVVVGLSGGVDSSVVAALCARALGPDRVLGLIMPEYDSSPESKALALSVARATGIRTLVEEIGPVLEKVGCYRRRDEAIRTVAPSYGPDYRCKLVLPDVASGARYAVPGLVIQSPSGETQRVRLTGTAYLQIVAATNFKQRVRKMMEYYHADRLQYAVAGTPNRLEYDQGFFVKNGDGSADVKPIAHLYKSQVYDMADYLGLPAEVRKRTATTDTFSMPQSQEEFFFAAPLHTLDLCIYAKNHQITPEATARATGQSVEQITAIFASIDAKRKATAYLHEHPLLVEPVPLS